MDSDCLIKITKAEMKEALTGAVDALITPTVVAETVDAAPPEDSVTAERIRRNVDCGRLRLNKTAARDRHPLAGLASALGDGERSVLDLLQAVGADAVATDDGRFSKLLRRNGIRVMGSAELLAFLLELKVVSKAEALEIVSRLTGLIPQDQYMEVRRAIDDA